MSLSELEMKFTKYYSKKFENEESDSKANKALRTEVIEAFKTAKKNGNTELAENIITLLAKNTGCSEDIELFINIANPLKLQGILTEEQINKVINQGASRWS